MRSTILADLFYKMNVNPFYVIVLFVFLVPFSSLVLFGIMLGFTLVVTVLFTVIVFLCCSILFYAYFHRNPIRKTLVDENAILSPADGKVVYVKEIQKGEIICSVKKKNRMKLTELLDVSTDQVQTGMVNGFIVGIELQLFDVHVTRSPISGEKLFDHHVSGRIVPMTNPLFEYINDRETVVIKQKSSDEANSLIVGVVQIATFITRTVKSFVREKTQIDQGEPIGMIRLGSQVDVVLFSSDVNVLVQTGDRVYAGITKIAEKT
jgi:phosphatidylserine decarboxylase